MDNVNEINKQNKGDANSINEKEKVYNAIKKGKEYIDKGYTSEDALALLSLEYSFLYHELLAVQKQLSLYERAKLLKENGLEI